MRPGFWYLVLVPLFVLANSPPHKTKLTVAYLTAIKGELKDRQGLAVSGALTMALNKVKPPLRNIRRVGTPGQQ